MIALLCCVVCLVVQLLEVDGNSVRDSHYDDVVSALKPRPVTLLFGPSWGEDAEDWRMLVQEADMMHRTIQGRIALSRDLLARSEAGPHPLQAPLLVTGIAEEAAQYSTGVVQDEAAAHRSAILEITMSKLIAKGHLQ